MKLNKRSMRLSVIMVGCFAALVVASRLFGATVPVSGAAGSKKVIVLDAGHGGMDSGAVGKNGVLEKNVNLAIVKNLEQLLKLSGFDVVLTRTEDISIHDPDVVGIRNQKLSDMDNRLEIIQSYPDSIFFCVHQNNFTQPEYFGGQMFYNNNHPDNRSIAQIMQNRFALLQPGNDREIKLSGGELFLLKNCNNPCLMIECGFLSNEKEEALLKTPEYQKKVAFTIYSGLLEYLALAEPEADDIEQAPETIEEQVFTTEQDGLIDNS